MNQWRRNNLNPYSQKSRGLRSGDPGGQTVGKWWLIILYFENAPSATASLDLQNAEEHHLASKWSHSHNHMLLKIWNDMIVQKTLIALTSDGYVTEPKAPVSSNKNVPMINDGDPVKSRSEPQARYYERMQPSPLESCPLPLRTATAGSDVVQSGLTIFDDFFQHLWPYIGNNTANVVFQMVKRLWLIRIDQ
ncbi:hypothetical protein TNCV_956701 [Trichonephila clavipes]|nr:hypothetical protein TNCV_956701 [Trichonephila clavipes]